MTREEFLSRIRQQIGAPYLYGGQHPDKGFDCSGIIVYCMELEKDKSSQQLFELFSNNVVSRMQAPPGSLYFYGENVHRISHVMTVLTHWDNGGITLVGARGGDSSVTSLDIAKEKKAFVDVCFGDYWLDKFVIAVDPFMYSTERGVV